MEELEKARVKLRVLRDLFKQAKDPRVQKIGGLLDLFLLASYDEDEIELICDIFEDYLDSLLGGEN